MKKLKSVLLLVSSGCWLIANPAQAKDCKEVHALIIDASAPEGCTSPFHFCAAGTVEGNRGLNGTTYFVLDGVAAGPASAPGWNSTSGLLVYTTSEGTLTIRETGLGKLSGSPSNGYITSIQEIVSGTGRFSGATGLLYNNATDVNSKFYSHIVAVLQQDGTCPFRRRPLHILTGSRNRRDHLPEQDTVLRAPQIVIY
jgi:hypothetical protein